MSKSILKHIAIGGIFIIGMPLLAHAQSGTRDIAVTPVQRPIYDIEAPQSDLKVTAWVDRADGRYRPGDYLKLYVRTNQDAYITVLDVGTSGKTHVIFPNRFRPDNHVLAHQVIEIPGPDDRFRLKIGGPAGTELIKVFATKKRRDLIRPSRLADAGPFKRVQGTTRSIARDIELELDLPADADEDLGEGRGEPLRAEGPEVARPVPAAARPGFATFNKVITILEPRAEAVRPAASKPTRSAQAFYRRAEAAYYGAADGASYRQALALYRKAANLGHVQAMLRVGRMYERGEAVRRNLSQAMHWYDKAAALGNTQAMVRLARLYGRGLGVPRNHQLAIRWLKKAASAGDGLAMLSLSRIYDEGAGVPPDERKAASYILAAIRAGAWIAQERVAHYSEATRKAVQRALRQANTYHGEIDGKIGPETRAALADYARAG